MKKLLLPLFCLFAMFTAKAQCDYTISGADTYGDGWNGGYVRISVNNVITDFTVPSSADADEVVTLSIPTYTDDAVTFTWNAGSYTSEVRFGVTSPDGTVLYTFGSAPADETIFVTDTSVSTCSAPSCLDPTSFAASGATATTVDLDWTAGDSETLWDLELVDVTASGSATGTPTTEDVTTNAYTLFNLAAQNDYQIYLRADCGAGDTSDWVGPVSFTAGCDGYTIPYFEGFETGYTHQSAVGGCITQEDISGTNFWKANDTYTGISQSPRTGSWNATLFYSGGPNTDWMFIPVSLTAGQSYDFEAFARHHYWYKIGNITVSYGNIPSAAAMTTTIVAETSTNGGATGGDYLQIAGSFTPSATATYYIGIKGYMGTSYDALSIDDISIVETPTCPVPSSLAASGETTTTVDLAWTAGGTEALWDIELVDVTASGSATGTPTTEDVTTNPYTLSGLTPENEYQIYLRADCGAGDTSDWVGPVTFRTDCDLVTTFPWSEDFDEGDYVADNSFLPYCFTSIDNNSDGDLFRGYSNTGIDDGWGVGIYTDFNSGSNDDYLVLPQFSFSTNMTLSYSLRVESSGEPNDYKVLLSTTGVDAADFTEELLPLTAVSNTEYVTQTIDLSDYTGAGDVYIALNVPPGGLDGWYLYFDEFQIYETPNCADASAAISAITSAEATATWAAAIGAASYDWEVVPTGNAQGIGVVASGSGETGLPATITGLTSNTEYDFLISSDCTSEYASAVSFLTASICSDTLDQFCYENGSNKIAFAEAPTGDYITVTIDGEIEGCCDILAVYDSLDDSGNVLYVNYGFPSGLQVESTTGFISVWVFADVSYSCSDGQGGPYTPIDISYSCFTPCNWTGTTSSDWADVSNWSTGAVPTSSDNVFIDGTFTNEPSISGTDAVAKTVIVATGNTLTIDETSSLTVSGDFTNTGTVTLNSTADDFSSLVVEGTATGDITYNRYVNVYNTDGGWDFVGSPTAMTIEDFTTANGGDLQILEDDFALASYNNATGQWELYPTESPTGSFTAGQGYAMATAAGSTVAFTGAMQTTDQTINVVNNDALNGVGRRWNLVSNPFPSYMAGNPDAATAAGTAANFLIANATVINNEFLYVYGWDGSDYAIYNNLSGAFSMAPGQGFWVAAESTVATALNFTADMRTTTGTGDFVSGPQLLTHHVAVKLFNGETERATTDFYFRDGLSLGLDPGYDAGAYNQSMALSTRLPQGNQETAFAMNAMDIDAMQNTRVPLEIRQNAGQTFRVSMSDMDLPEDIYVYLEDTLNGTLTSLKDQDFELEAQSDLSGVDRFFIVFKSNSVLSNGDSLGLSALNVYKANNDSFVTIAGITPELEKLDVTIYSILGQTVREKSLYTTTATQRVSTQGLASGLYMVQIKSGNQTTVKKVIVK